MSWLDLVPVSDDVFYYKNNLLCHDCGVALRDKLRRAGVGEDDMPSTYPDGGGEADSAQFCGNDRRCVNAVTIIPGLKIGCPLGCPLTSDGGRAVTESILRDLVSSHAFARRVGRVLYKIWGDYAKPHQTFERVHPQHVGTLGEKLPKSLQSALKKYVRTTPEKAADVYGEVYCDSENVYLAASRGPERRHGRRWGTAVDLLRAPVSDEGEFESIEVVSVPPAAAIDIQVDVLLREAIETMAWD